MKKKIFIQEVPSTRNNELQKYTVLNGGLCIRSPDEHLHIIAEHSLGGN